MCDNDADSPFCSPQDGAQLQTGETVTITWNPLFFTTASFPEPPFEIFIQADFPITDNGPPETAGFTSTPLDPNAGAFPWRVLASYLPPTGNSSTALLSIAAPLPQTSTNGSFIRIGAGTTRFPGPQVHILRSPNPTTTTSTTTTATPSNNPSPLDQQQQTQQQAQQQQESSPNPLAIALPIAFGLLTALAMIGYALLKRHRPETLARLAFWNKNSNSSGGGYGGGKQQQQQQQRVRLKGRDVEIKVVRTDLEGLRANAARMAVGGNGGRGGGGLREGV